MSPAVHYPPAKLWERALRHLHRIGWNDGRIAEALRDLSDRAIRRLCAHASNGDKVLTRVAQYLAGGRTARYWTAARVRQYRRRKGLAGNPQDDQSRQKNADSHRRRSIAALDARGMPRELYGLPPRAADVLDALRAAGRPLTRRELANLLGVSYPAGLKPDGVPLLREMESREVVTRQEPPSSADPARGHSGRRPRAYAPALSTEVVSLD